MYVQEVSTPEKLNKALMDVHEDFKKRLKETGTSLVPIAGVGANPVMFKQVRTPLINGLMFKGAEQGAEYAYAMMKACLMNKLPQNEGPMSKASIGMSSNLYGYDLRAPSIHLIPFLSPLRDETPRVQREQPGNAANWKVINAASFSTGGFAATPFLNEGQRAPLETISATTITAPYATIGIDGSDTYEAQSSGKDFEDPLSTARFLGLEGLMVKEEHSILGGNKSLKLGTANTPGTLATATSAGATLNGTYYVAVVGLTYEGYNNQSVSAGLIGQMSLTTPDNKTMQVNGGIGIKSAISSGQAVSTGNNLTAAVTAKLGEYAWAWYVGASNTPSAMYLQQITTAPVLTLTALNSSNQAFNLLTSTDFSVNDGTTGGGSNQVTGFDGYMTQCLNAAYNNGGTANAYQVNLAGAKLTASGRGSVKEIDTALQVMWNNPNWRTTVDKIWVNAQELVSITNLCLSNASGPLVRYELSGDGDHLDMTASGTVSFYFNPFIPGGGRKIPIEVHPTLPPGTIFMQGKRLPPYFKKSNMTNVAEVITKRDYYSIDWAPITREYQFGTYSEEVLAVYAPFALAMIQGCLPS